VGVLVVGDVNVDIEIRLPTGAAPTHANPDPRMFGGGSAANTAAALGRLGVPCHFVGAVGDDSFGRFAVSSLEEAGVDVGGISVSASDPTVAVITVLDPAGDRLIYVWPPTGGAHAWLRPADVVDGLGHASWLHVSGIALRVLPARDVILGAMQRARAAGIPVSIDLNLRLENWGWQDGFRGVAERALALSDVVLGSAVDEIAPLAGIDDPVSAATTLSSGGRVVVARRGRAGAVACSPDGVVEVPGFAVDTTDTVGAGDAFDAGFIASRLRGAGLGESLRRGNAVAALTITRPGARSTPTGAEVDAFLEGHPATR
jgi:sugar/nucleoside kinase (ribokinase family)